MQEKLTDKDLNLIGAKWHINMFDDVDKAEIFAFARAAPQPATQPVRADFEAWFRENHHSRLDRKCANQTYNCPAAFAAWNTWEACAKLYVKPQP